MIKPLIILLVLSAVTPRRSPSYSSNQDEYAYFNYFTPSNYYTSPDYSPSSNYQLSPSIPPHAFVGQYYTCNFRVQGLSNPTYKFSNLPSFLRATSNGVIEGIPDNKGTYAITVQYSSGRNIGQERVVLSVSIPAVKPVSVRSTKTPTLQKTQIATVATVANVATVATVASTRSFPCLYNAGQKIWINLTEYVGTPARGWTYQYLPADLDGGSDGCLKGQLQNKGLYTFAAVYSDTNGVQNSLIISLNIQPSPTYGYSRNDYIVQVPVVDSCNCDANAIFQAKEKAQNAQLAAQKDVYKCSAEVAKIKTKIGNYTGAIKLSQEQVAQYQSLQKKALTYQLKLVKENQYLQNLKDAAKGKYALALTSQKQAKHNYLKAQQALQCAQKNLDKANTTRGAASQAFINAQTASSIAANNVSSIMLQIISNQQDVHNAFQSVVVAKTTLQQMNGILTSVGFNTSNLSNNKDIADMQNNIASAAYNTASAAVNDSYHVLANASHTVERIKDEVNGAQIGLGIARFNLTQATNQLLVAQAFKEQVDKNVAIISAQSSKPVASTSYIFGGCEQGPHPTFSGTAVVLDKVANGVKLNSGHTLMLGSCTKGAPLDRGDVIQFQGYLKDGLIHGLALSK